MAKKRSYRSLFPVIEVEMKKALRRTKRADGKTVSCRKGCAHCCHLLVEATWEEGVEVARFIEKLPRTQRNALTKRLQEAATERRKFFSRWKKTRKFVRPVASSQEIPDHVFDKFFERKARPCPFLDEHGACSVYPARPTACRFHVVVSPAENCDWNVPDSAYYEVPDQVEELKQSMEDDIIDAQDDGRWGELSIVVDTILRKRHRERARKRAARSP